MIQPAHFFINKKPIIVKEMQDLREFMNDDVYEAAEYIAEQLNTRNKYLDKLLEESYERLEELENA